MSAWQRSEAKERTSPAERIVPIHHPLPAIQACRPLLCHPESLWLFQGPRLFFLGTRIPYPNMNCHPDRSVAKWRACPERSRMGTCSSLHQPTDAHGSVGLPFVIPSGHGLARPPKVMKNTFCLVTALDGSVALPFVIPSEAEGSAVPRTFPGSVFNRAQKVESVAARHWTIHTKSERGDFPFENSPLRSDLSKIRFGYLITRLSSRKPSRPRKLSPRFPLSSVLTLIARASYLPLSTIQFPGRPRESRYRSSSWLYSALSWKITLPLIWILLDFPGKLRGLTHFVVWK
jgi:hypothetical protein